MRQRKNVSYLECILLLLLIVCVGNVHAGIVNRALSGTATTDLESHNNDDPSFGPQHSIDGSDGTRWLTQDGGTNPNGFINTVDLTDHYLSVDLGAQFPISSYSLVPRSQADANNGNRWPRDFRLHGSNDPTFATSVQLHATTLNPYPGDGAVNTQNFVIGAPGNYRYYRMFVDEIIGGATGRVQLGDFELLEVSIDSELLGSPNYVPGKDSSVGLRVTGDGGGSLTVSQVEFLIDGVSVGTDTTATGAVPTQDWSVPWTPLAIQDYTLTARATINGTPSDFNFPITSLPNPNLTNHALTGTATSDMASHNNDDGAFGPQFMVDGTNGTRWLTNTVYTGSAAPLDEYLQVDIGAGLPSVNGYFLVASTAGGGFGYPDRWPTDWTLYGSNDPTFSTGTFTVLSTITGEAFTGQSTVHAFTLAATQNFRYYHIAFDANGGTNRIMLGQFGLTEETFGDVNVTSPASDIISDGSQIALSATVSNVVAPLTEVRFYAGGVLVGTDTNTADNDFSVNFTPSGAGALAIVAVAQDNVNNCFISTENVNVLLPLFVDVTSQGTGDGSSFINAMDYNTARAASANLGGALFVKTGNYTLGGAQPAVTGSLNIYGGFAGTESLLSERPASFTASSIDAAGNQVFQINSGGILLDGIDVSNAAGVNGAVVGLAGGTFSVDGCDFSNNAATGRGGAVYLVNPNGINVNECTMSFNTSGSDGGAIFVTGGSGSGIMSITSSTFHANESDDDGGALYLDGAMGAGSTLANCDITSNTGGLVLETFGGKAGGVFIFRHTETLTVDSCRFLNNTNEYGGALYVQLNTSVDFSNCVFADNLDRGLGDIGNNIPGGAFGVIGNGGVTNLNIANCVFNNNSTTSPGYTIDGISFDDEVNLSVINSIFTNHRSAIAFNGLNGAQAGDFALSNNLFENSPTDNLATATTALVNENVLTAAPMFTDASNDDYTLLGGSPAINAGVAVASLGGTDYFAPLADITGQVRPQFTNDLGVHQSVYAYAHITPNPHEFGNVYDVRGTTLTATLTVHNGGLLPVDVSAGNITNSPYMAIVGGTLTTTETLAVGETRTVDIDFAVPFNVDFVHSAFLNVPNTGIEAPKSANLTADTFRGFVTKAKSWEIYY